MRITRRHLAVAGALALGGLGLLRSSSAVAESAEELRNRPKPPSASAPATAR